MAQRIGENGKLRLNFGTRTNIDEMPYLLSVQMDSYRKFTQQDLAPEKRDKGLGLEAVFRSIFPIYSSTGNVTLEYVHYRLGEPKFNVEECRMRDKTYSAPLWVKLRLVIRETGASRTSKPREIREQEVYMGEIPLMLKHGSFVVNGTERVIVSQLHRSPGVIFDHDKGKTHSSGKLLYSARIIPYRGSWLDFEFDPRDLVYVRIDRRRKLPVTVLLRAMEYTAEEILATFFEDYKFSTDEAGQLYTFHFEDPERLRGQALPIDVRQGNEVLVEAGWRITSQHVRKLKSANFRSIQVPADFVIGHILSRDIIDPETGEVAAPCNSTITSETLEKMAQCGVNSFTTIYVNDLDRGAFISDTLREDPTSSREEALIEIYRIMRPGNPPTLEEANTLFKNLFFSEERYDLSRVGRMKFNHRLGRDESSGDMTLSREDIVSVIRTLVAIRNGEGGVDDIDHLGNRRVRSVGEMAENRFRIGLARIERAVKDRLIQAEQDELQPRDLVNAKPISGALREFFSSSQLSQFMDQNNPLAEITHKRRVSALGPGGLTRERAGFEVRDVHPTHYGRVCSIETPEGPNIGLINSLAVFGRINEYGFIETPYRKVVKGKVTDVIEYLSAINEHQYVIAQASAVLDKRGRFAEDLVAVRHSNEFSLMSPDRIDYMDVSPQQPVSVAASLIPFLEHDDANRALMGSNMQRQAVPLVRAEAPLIGTGMEHKVARDSGVCVVARRSGVVESVDAGRIVVRVREGEIRTGQESAVDIYNLVKYTRSNQDTCVNHKVTVRKGDSIRRGDIIADGPAVEGGEVALGQNMRIAFMPWNGYNFEDSILVSERVAMDDRFTSVHIEKFTCIARETKLGREEITADIPNVGEGARTKIDESGVVYIGAEVQPGDILVGRISPKSETQLTPEEKLVYAIFGEKAVDVKDTSTRVPAGMRGTVIDVQVFVRDRKEKNEDPRALEIEQHLLEQVRKDLNEELKTIEKATFARARSLLLDKLAVSGAGLKRGAKLSARVLEDIEPKKWLDLRLRDEAANARLQEMAKQLRAQRKRLDEEFKEQEQKITSEDELATGVLKVVKVYLAVKRRIQPGDKMAGRHGNKGVISAVVPVEDMPYDENGEPVDIVLNPLGVPSRMNVGQVLEAHLGLAAHGLGRKVEALLQEEKSAARKSEFLREIYRVSEGETPDFSKLGDGELRTALRKLRRGVPMASPVFDGCNEEQIKDLLRLAGQPEDGQMRLYDGRTGEAYERPVTVGYMYIMKLNHLVDDKMHARSTGSYSLVTQQPLGGKAQFGGQRFGEMEVWALEAYGAAYVLQEMLTVKSDDMAGRNRIYKNTVDGEYMMEAEMPESFNVLMQEIRALGIDIDLEQSAPERMFPEQN